MKAFILKSLRAFFMGVADCIRKKKAVKNHITLKLKRAEVIYECVLFYR
jgi:hypothetical protein